MEYEINLVFYGIDFFAKTGAKNMSIATIQRPIASLTGA